jgi:hypothetical protein
LSLREVTQEAAQFQTGLIQRHATVQCKGHSKAKSLSDHSCVSAAAVRNLPNRQNFGGETQNPAARY